MKNNILCAITGAAFMMLILSGDAPVWCRLVPMIWLVPFLWVNFGAYVLEDLKEAMRE